MGLTMNKILERFNDSNKFSLTGSTSGFRNKVYEVYNITEEDVLNALEKRVEYDKEIIKNMYELNKEKFASFPSFEELYEQLKQECYHFSSEEIRKLYLDKFYNDKNYNFLKNASITDLELEQLAEDYIINNYLEDNVGKITKYGNKNKDLFLEFYKIIYKNINRKNNKEKYYKEGKSPLEQIPSELKEHFLYYEVSFFNQVTLYPENLMINFYFKLNDETKNWLLKSRNDFEIKGDLADLTLYKDNKMEFTSCTHEGFNSIEFNYKNMSKEEIVDFINDEYYKESNDKVIETVNKLITMETGTKFSFEELGVDSEEIMYKIYNVCDKLNLNLVSSKNIFFDIKDIIEKKS